MDSTSIAAPPSTRNREHQRDPEAHQGKKGNEWHFGYKARVGADKDREFAHTLQVTAANVHDVSVASGSEERSMVTAAILATKNEGTPFAQQAGREND